MKIGLVGSIHELGWEVLRSQGHSIVEVTDVSENNLKKERKKVRVSCLYIFFYANDFHPFAFLLIINHHQTDR